MKKTVILTGFSRKYVTLLTQALLIITIPCTVQYGVWITGIVS